MAQLAEWSLLTPEVRRSNPDISEILSTNCTLEKTKIKKKRQGMANHKNTLEKIQFSFYFQHSFKNVAGGLDEIIDLW